MMKEKNIGLCIVLSIFTGGIYLFFWIASIQNQLNSEERSINSHPSGLAVALLTLITCGLYGIYWVYRASQRTDALTDYYNNKNSDTAILNLILRIVGLPIISLCVLQSNLNQCVTRY